jgi:hypothetical protein
VLPQQADHLEVIQRSMPRLSIRRTMGQRALISQSHAVEGNTEDHSTPAQDRCHSRFERRKLNTSEETLELYCPNLHGTPRRSKQVPGYHRSPTPLPKQWSCNRSRTCAHKSSRFFGNGHVAGLVVLAIVTRRLVEETEAHILVGLLLLCRGR